MFIDKNTDLKVGSIVRLRAGGPMMTVVWLYDVMNDKPQDEKISNDQFVRTMWFDQNDILHEAKFNIKTLVIQ